ncbi:hypothetical protein PYW07_012459 [Mythimna separata]|uniref:MD-2-related lipid-recognition domain-containing protein n=1 Tax=Mythimna separata TaxID=271217 RepID=A0AAD7YLR3_MYTSE|nr:hypothetical protein PYW07_012459 [Mythimna separata]
MGLTEIVLFAAVLACGTAHIATYTLCEDSDEAICKISEVRIDPCPKKTCVFPQGSNASMAFDFTPNFSSSNLKTMVYWAQGAGDIPFQGFGSDNACDYTACPTVPGQLQALNYNLHVGRKLPKGSYPLRWKLWNVDNEAEKCCFRINIRLTKPRSK